MTKTRSVALLAVCLFGLAFPLVAPGCGGADSSATSVPPTNATQEAQYKARAAAAAKEAPPKPASR